MEWFHSFVYEANKGMLRKPLWISLKEMKVVVLNSHWLIWGDFNVVLCSKEKWGKEKLNSYEIEFKEVLNYIEVSDLMFNGSYFTWSNKRKGDAFIASKIDQVLANVG